MVGASVGVWAGFEVLDGVDVLVTEVCTLGVGVGVWTGFEVPGKVGVLITGVCAWGVGVTAGFSRVPLSHWLLCTCDTLSRGYPSLSVVYTQPRFPDQVIILFPMKRSPPTSSDEWGGRSGLWSVMGGWFPVLFATVLCLNLEKLARLKSLT